MSSNICRKCKKPLSNLKSMERGLGPECYKAQGIQASLMPEDENVVMLPFEGDVVCRREEDKKYMNIPHTIVKHSPTGLEWGFSGSGPADFALNVLFFFTNDKGFSTEFHQDFKFKFIAALPPEGGTIPGNLIKEYIIKNGGKLK